MKAKVMLMFILMLVAMVGFAATAEAQTICDITDVTPLSRSSARDRVP